MICIANKPRRKSVAKNNKVSKKTPDKTASKKPRKNISRNIPNGTLVITNDKNFAGTDGQSNKTRMSVVADSNRKDELALVKYTTSGKHGRKFDNDKGFLGHGDMIFTKDNEGRPIVIDGEKFIQGNSGRAISHRQANEIKRRNVKESRYRRENIKRLKRLKNR